MLAVFIWQGHIFYCIIKIRSFLSTHLFFMKKLAIFYVLFFMIFVYFFTPMVPFALADCNCICEGDTMGQLVTGSPGKTNSACANGCSQKGKGVLSCEDLTTTPANNAPSGNCDGSQVCLKDPLGIDPKLGPQQLLARIIGALLAFVGIGALVTFVYAGFMFLISAGNPEQVKKAKDTMLYAAIGAAVSMGSYAILSYILGILQGASGN